MKKLGLSLVVISMMFAAPAFAEPKPAVDTVEDSSAIRLNSEDDRLCNDAKIMQTNRIRDLKAAIEFDKETERKLLEGAKVRDDDAARKEDHAAKWRAAASRQTDTQKQNTFNAFAGWLEGEAKTDRRFAGERRDAARIIGKGWREAFNAIAGHERFLADLNTKC